MGTKVKTFFTSDLHFSHPSILYFHPERRDACGITLEELQEDKMAAISKHDEWLIDLWNSTVSKTDNVYILGDFCLGNRVQTEKILNKLHGKKFLIRGNHDKSCNGLDNYFQWVGDIKEIKFTNNQYEYINPNETFCVECCHYPMLTWNRRPHGTCHLHGHCHGTVDIFNEISDELRVDVGLDGKLSNYNLIPLETIYNYFTNKLNKAGVSTFNDYNEWLMEKQGFRM
jgi:calcineurin-like phosphoesterase family protein